MTEPKKTKWIVELQPGCYLDGSLGDPGRTLRLHDAKRYDTQRGAQIALGFARKYRPFLDARVLPVD